MTDFSPLDSNQDASRREPATPCLFWLTDFGQKDGYVGVMKAVVMKLLAKHATNIPVAMPVTMIDVSHDIPAFDIRSGAWVLERLLPYAPNQSVFVCIVDPHVGSPEQLPLALYCPQKAWVFLAPDNGLLTPVIDYLTDLGLVWQAYPLDKPVLDKLLGVAENTVSVTFHGRDIYSPIAAWALTYLRDSKGPFGEVFTEDRENHCQPVVFENWQASHQIVYIDHFGNVMTRLSPDDWSDSPVPGQQYLVKLRNGTFSFRWVRHYQEDHTKEVVGLWGSHGYLEWACPSGNAAMFLKDHFGLSLLPGQSFTLEKQELGN